MGNLKSWKYEKSIHSMIDLQLKERSIMLKRIRCFFKKNKAPEAVTCENHSIEPISESNSSPRISHKQKVLEEYGFELPSDNTEKLKVGRQFEKAGDVEKAIVCYEACIKNRFDGNSPYDRLVKIYKKNGDRKNQERVLKKAISIFTKVANSGRSDGQVKLDKFLQALESIKSK